MVILARRGEKGWAKASMAGSGVVLCDYDKAFTLPAVLPFQMAFSGCPCDLLLKELQTVGD